MMKVTYKERNKLVYYLKKFYERYPLEKYTIMHFVRYFKQRHKNNKQTYMAVAGEAGVGKSLFVLMSMALYGRPMNLDDNVVYIPTANEISDKLSKLNFSSLLVDEAARSMRAVSWHSKDQQKVTMLAQTERFKRNWIFLNIPNFNEITKSLRTGSIIFRVIVLYRTNNYARVILQRKTRNWRSEDPWGDREANKKYQLINKKKGVSIDNEKILEIERNTEGYVFDFIVPDLTLILPSLVEEYEKNKEESRIKMEEEDAENNPKNNKYKDKYHDILGKVYALLKYDKFAHNKLSFASLARELDADSKDISKSFKELGEEPI